MTKAAQVTLPQVDNIRPRDLDAELVEYAAGCGEPASVTLPQADNIRPRDLSLDLTPVSTAGGVASLTLPKADNIRPRALPLDLAELRCGGGEPCTCFTLTAGGHALFLGWLPAALEVDEYSGTTRVAAWHKVIAAPPSGTVMRARDFSWGAPYATAAWGAPYHYYDREVLFHVQEGAEEPVEKWLSIPCNYTGDMEVTIGGVPQVDGETTYHTWEAAADELDTHTFNRNAWQWVISTGTWQGWEVSTDCIEYTEWRGADSCFDYGGRCEPIAASQTYGLSGYGRKLYAFHPFFGRADFNTEAGVAPVMVAPFDKVEAHAYEPDPNWENAIKPKAGDLIVSPEEFDEMEKQVELLESERPWVCPRSHESGMAWLKTCVPSGPANRTQYGIPENRFFQSTKWTHVWYSAWADNLWEEEDEYYVTQPGHVTHHAGFVMGIDDECVKLSPLGKVPKRLRVEYDNAVLEAELFRDFALLEWHPDKEAFQEMGMAYGSTWQGAGEFERFTLAKEGEAWRLANNTTEVALLADTLAGKYYTADDFPNRYDTDDPPEEAATVEVSPE